MGVVFVAVELVLTPVVQNFLGSDPPNFLG
jgi:hypothetical protein